MSRMVNTRFGTEPLVFHAQGYHDFKPVWPKLKDWVFSKPPQALGPRPRITVMTCNNGHVAMGLFEESVERLGIPIMIAGREFPEWINAVHKPQAILNALDTVTTDWVLCADSRDAILAGDPEILVDRMERDFDAGMVFGACAMSWPNARDLTQYERSLPAAEGHDYKHLNGGIWIARTEVAKRYFAAVVDCPPHEAAPESEQGKLRKVFPDFVDEVALDYGVRLFHNVGFVFEDTYEMRPDAAASTAVSISA